MDKANFGVNTLVGMILEKHLTIKHSNILKNIKIKYIACKNCNIPPYISGVN